MGKVTVDKHSVLSKQIIDSETGEILQEHKEESHDTKTITPAEPPFIKIYLQDIMYMCDMPKAYTELTYCLLKRASYANAEEGLCVTLAQYTKTKILNECNWEKMQTLNNALNKLVKGNILKRLGTGVYQFNPHIFGRGEWKDISKIRLTWDYDMLMKNKTFATSITYAEEKEAEEKENTEPKEPVAEPKERKKKQHNHWRHSRPNH